ncbi:digestive organ expansion factor homolog isoform X2 [Anneissia japonica]|uniref:digestive organ expansion factor homolog isoform X2 n=1 Tax=Anneissia japonica TaxID=1529436 RepID=UPI0014259122|nr:digestive organ expansion factor homolog isoform X2 [Anneissia japonica]
MRGKRSRHRGGIRGRGRGSKKRRVDKCRPSPGQMSSEIHESNLPSTANTAHAGSLTGKMDPASLLKTADDDWSSESEEESPLDLLLSSFGDKKNLTRMKYDDNKEEGDEDNVEGDEDIDLSDDNSSYKYEIDEKNARQEELVDNEDEENKEQDENEENEDVDEGDEDEEENGDDADDESIETSTGVEYKDPFFRRVNHVMEQKDIDRLKEKPGTIEMKWPQLGQIKFQSSEKNPTQPQICQESKLSELYVRKRISERWQDVNKEYLNAANPDEVFSPLQREIFSIMNGYKDLLYCNRTHHNAEELRLTYCLHVLNHIVKSRQVVLKHNTMLSQNQELDTDEFRDQGLTRPRILILVPFRDAAWKIVNMFAKLLLPADQQQISHRKRFNQEYGDQGHESSKIKRPDDFEATFAGNIDDHFRLGIGISRKSMRLYTDFYKSDIIIASPLGLRTVIGAEGDKHRDWDFLSSVEVLIIDQADVFLMQNWEHIMHIMDHLHLQPKKAHDVDFSRVRMWTLNGWSSYYRQTLVFNEVNVPEINALFNKKCFNFSGGVAVVNRQIMASICHVTTQLPQVFHKLNCSCYPNEAKTRFDFFITKILPQYSDAVMSRTLIYIPSYFDFVRVRNHFRKNDLNFAQICEYSLVLLGGERQL